MNFALYVFKGILQECPKTTQKTPTDVIGSIWICVMMSGMSPAPTEAYKDIQAVDGDADSCHTTYLLTKHDLPAMFDSWGSSLATDLDATENGFRHGRV